MYPGSRAVLSKGGANNSASPTSRLINSRSSDAMARSARSREAAPDMTAQDCAMESIRHSSLTEAPSGVPSSK